MPDYVPNDPLVAARHAAGVGARPLDQAPTPRAGSLLPKSWASTPASILSVLIRACAIALTWSGLATIGPVPHRGSAPAPPPWRCRWPRPPPRLPWSAAARRPPAAAPGVDPAVRPRPAVLPDHHLREGAVDVHPDHPLHAVALRPWPWERWATRATDGCRARGATGRVRGRAAESVPLIFYGYTRRSHGGAIFPPRADVRHIHRTAYPVSSCRPASGRWRARGRGRARGAGRRRHAGCAGG